LHYETVIFDAGLTLIYDHTPAAELASEALSDLGCDVDPASLEDAMGAAMSALRLSWLRGDHWLSEAGVRSLFVDAYREGLESLPLVAGDNHLVRRLANTIYDAYADPIHWRAFPDVVPTLDALAAAGIRMGVVSDWGHSLDAILLGLELSPYFEFLIASARVGMSKPHPGVFELALARTGAEPDGVLYVGDTYVKDVLGARAAGITPVLLDRSGQLPRMDCRAISDLTHLLEIVGVPSNPVASAEKAGARTGAGGVTEGTDAAQGPGEESGRELGRQGNEPGASRPAFVGKIVSRTGARAT